MKFTSALSLCLAGVAAAKSVHNRHSERRRSESQALAERSNIGLEGLPLGIAGFGISNTVVKEVIIIWIKPAGTEQRTTINTQIGGGQTLPPPGSTATQSAPGGVQTHSVIVGGPAGLVFTPDQMKVNLNDMIVFTYLAQNHTVTQSAFETPCDPLAGGMDSGFQPNPDNTAGPPPQVAMQVTTDKPLWFFCRQNGHCGKGMVFSVNPTAKNTHALFQSKAIQQKGKGGGTGIVGGTPPPPPEGSAAPPPPPPAESSAAPPPPPPEGSAAPPPPPPESPSATVSGALPGATDGVTVGTGTILPDGACFCAVQCASIQVPAVDSQALGAFGGSLGSVPMNVPV